MFYGRCHVRLDIRSADLDIVECDFDCLGPDVGHLWTREWTRGDVNHTPEHVIWVLGNVILSSGNVMLDYRVRNVGQIHTCDWTNPNVKLDMCGREADPVAQAIGHLIT